MKKTRVASFLQTVFFCILLFTVANTTIHAQDNGSFLEMRNSRLFIDGVMLQDKGGSFAGRIVWFSLPKQGQFIISTAPQKGYKFEQIAEVKGSIISFTLADKFFELTSSEPILNNGNEMKLWVFHDIDFQPKGSEKGVFYGAASHFDFFLKHRKPEKSY